MEITLRACLACLLITALIGEIQAASPVVVKIPRGTSMRFETEKFMAPRTVKRGDNVPLRLTQALIVDGIEVVPAGFEAHGVVSEVEAPTPCSPGSIDWQVKQLRLPNGRNVRVTKMYVPQDGFIPARYPERNLGPSRVREVIEVILWSPVIALYCIASLLNVGDFSGAAAPCQPIPPGVRNAGEKPLILSSRWLC